MPGVCLAAAAEKPVVYVDYAFFERGGDGYGLEYRPRLEGVGNIEIPPNGLEARRQLVVRQLRPFFGDERVCNQQRVHRVVQIKRGICGHSNHFARKGVHHNVRGKGGVMLKAVLQHIPFA
jgi:hypothetical protein